MIRIPSVPTMTMSIMKDMTDTAADIAATDKSFTECT